jgi:hypothetical protein
MENFIRQVILILKEKFILLALKTLSPSEIFQVTLLMQGSAIRHCVRHLSGRAAINVPITEPMDWLLRPR